MANRDVHARRIADLRVQLASAVMREPDDHARVESILRSISESQASLQQAVVEHVIAVRAVLRSDQRPTFEQMVAEHIAPSPHAGLSAMLSPEFAVALVLVSFAYSGWNGATYVAGEVRAPARTLPLALLLGTLLVMALYLALNVVYLAAAPASDLAGVVEVANVAAQRLVGGAAGRALSGLIALVLASSVGAMVMAGSRVYEAMGRDHRALSFLARRTPRGAPGIAVAVQAAIALAMVATASFGTLLGFIGFTLSMSAGLTVLGVLVLRVREPELGRPYRTWGCPVTPLLFVALSIWMIWHSLLERPTSSIAGVATITAALALYVLVARAGSPKPSAAPSRSEGDT